VLLYLKDREGKGFESPLLQISLENGTLTEAIVSIYEGPNAMTDAAPAQRPLAMYGVERWQEA